MKLNRISTFLLPLIVLAGCSGSAEYGDQTMAPKSTADSGQATTPSELANYKQDKEVRTAVNKRAVVRAGSLTVRVPNAEEAEKKVARWVTAKGGFIASSESSDLASAAPSITLSARIPVEVFDEALDTVEAMGVRLAKKVTGEDVTTKIVDFDARMKILQAQEVSLRNALAKSSYNSQSVELQERLMRLREEIESLTAQRKSLSDLATLSTLDITLQGETKAMAQVNDQGWVQESWNGATGLLATGFRIIASMGIFLLVLAPIWGPIAFFIVRSVRRPAVPR